MPAGERRVNIGVEKLQQLLEHGASIQVAASFDADGTVGCASTTSSPSRIRSGVTATMLWTGCSSKARTKGCMSCWTGRRHRRDEPSRVHPHAFRFAEVEGYEALEPLLENDPQDRHVLACAIKAQVHTIVTFNLKDFPPSRPGTSRPSIPTTFC